MRYLVIGAHRAGELTGAGVTAIPIGSDLELSALEIPEEQPLGDREFLLRVAGLRADLQARGTFVAIRYGFAPRSTAEAASVAAKQAVRWRELLDRYAGCSEMTLKVAAGNPSRRPDRKEFASGAEYLRALHSAAHGASIDPAFRSAADEAFRPLAVETNWLHRDEKSVECALLVRRGDEGAARSAASQLRERFPAVPFLFSGPWPLEVFADER